MTSRSVEGPGDRRRRRGREGSRPSESPGDTSQQPRQAGDGQEKTVALSRTLFSALEPSLDAIGSFGAPIVLAGTVGLVSGIVVVAFVGSMYWYGIADIAIGGGLILMVALISLSSVMSAFLSRSGRYGVNTTIMIAAFTGIVVVINFVSFENNNRTDVTATNQSSLHNSTKRLLKNLDQPVRATAFYLEDLDPNPSQGTLDQLARRSNVGETFREFEVTRSSKFEYRFVDYTLEPELVRDYFGSIQTPFINETIVVENTNSGIIDVIQPSDKSYSELEQDLYSSILVVTGQEQKTVYFLGGHGERAIQNRNADGYSSIQEGLESDNYDVRTLWWDTSDENISVPDAPAETCADDDQTCQPGAALLVIAGPTEELPQAHAAELHRFLGGLKLDGDGEVVERREAGRLIFLAEPDTPQSFLGFMATWGVLLGQGYIRDEARSVPDLPHALQLSRLPDELLRSIGPAAPLIQIAAPQGRFLGETRLTGTAPIIITGDPNRESIPLAITSDESYLIDDLGRTEPRKDAGDESDTQGPFQTIVYVQALAPVGSATPSTRPDSNRIANMVIFGDSDFINNFNFSLGSGADFFLNSANYLLGDYSLVSIRPKAYTFREFNLDRNERRFVRWTSILLIPGFLGLMATFVWWVRR
jgi:hypothetical protein